jgi:hypothetical protein
LYRELDRKGLPQDEYDQLLDDVRVMESAALKQMHINREQQK